MEAVQSGQASIFSFIYQVVGGLNGVLSGLGRYFTDDLNNAIATGYWALNKDLYHNGNFPDMAYGGLIVWAVNNDKWILQIVFSSGGSVYTRARNEHLIWSEWKINFIP